MKHEFDTKKPEYLAAPWPGKFTLFSWLEYAINIPYPVFLITTIKENGKPNACLHSWGCFGGDGQGYYSILTMLKSYHTYANIIRSGEWCLNFPTAAYHSQSMATIEVNGMENDEISEAGFTLEPASVIKSPRIAECPINVECTLVWEKPFSPESGWQVFTGRVIHLAVDESAFELDPQKRMQTLNTMYNLRSTLNPLTGKAGPAGMPVIGKPFPGSQK